MSPFFFKLFTQEFAEKGLNEVQLHGLNAAEVEDFLLVVSSRLSAKPVHPNRKLITKDSFYSIFTLRTFPAQNMAALLELAEYFDVPFLTQELGHLFPVFAEIPMHIRLTLAVRYRLTEVKVSEPETPKLQRLKWVVVSGFSDRLGVGRGIGSSVPAFVAPEVGRSKGTRVGAGRISAGQKQQGHPQRDARQLHVRNEEQILRVSQRD